MWNTKNTNKSFRRNLYYKYLHFRQLSPYITQTQLTGIASQHGMAPHSFTTVMIPVYCEYYCHLYKAYSGGEDWLPSSLHIIYTSLKIMKCWVKFRIFDLLIIPKRINVKILIHELSIMTYFCYHLLVRNRENKFVLVELVFNHIKNQWYRIVIANIKYRKVLRNCNGTKYIKCGIALRRNLRLGYPGQIIKHASQIWLVATGGFKVYAIFCFFQLSGVRWTHRLLNITAS